MIPYMQFDLFVVLDTLQILAHRNWEWWTMEPKYDLRFVSVMKDTPSSSTDKVSQDP